MYKHFPGHGGTTADSHEGYVYVDDTLEELENSAFVPFKDGIANDIRVIMVSHIAAPNVTGDNTPATLSKKLTTDILREDLGFDGMVITDALDMGAITEQYGSANAAVAALNAGADMLLMRWISRVLMRACWMRWRTERSQKSGSMNPWRGSWK